MEIELLEEKDKESCTSLFKKNAFNKGSCPEHIIFVLDACKEEDMSCFCLSEGSQHTPLELLKKALTIFMHNKSFINSTHRYGLVLLQDAPYWKVDFTTNSQELIDELANIEQMDSPAKCDLAQLFSTINENISLPVIKDGCGLPPFVIRTIFIYGRSNCLPQFLETRDIFLSLYNDPCFFLDVLYTHDPPSDDNRCEGIFDLLCKLDEDNSGYVFDASRNATKIFSFFGNLLAHPLQRPLQDDIHCKLTPD